MRKLINLLVAVSIFAFSSCKEKPAGNTQNIPTAQLDTNSIFIGEQTNFTIENELSNTSIWPTYEEFLVEGVEIIQVSKLDTTENIISQTFTITAWDSGSYYIPVIEFSENSKTEELLLNVSTVILEENAELKDIKQPIEEPIGWSDIWPWLLGIVLLSLVIYLLKKYVFTKKDEMAKPKIVTPADIIALNSLATLRKKELWQEGKIKLYYVTLSEIIRKYLEQRYQFIALELPTNDIIKRLNDLSMKSEIIQKIYNLLQRSDLAKFAKNKPTDLENTESLNIAIEIIEETKIIIQELDYKNTENAGCLLQILSFIMPLIGLILYLVWKDAKPQASKDCGSAALWGWLIGMLCSLIAGIIFWSSIKNLY